MILKLERLRLALKWLVLCAVICGLFPGASTLAQEGDYNQRTLDIPSQRADDAIKALARVNERSVLFQTDDIMEITSNRLKGTYSLQQALDIMFQGTNLQGSLTDSGTIIVSHRKEENVLGGNKPMQSKKSRSIITPALSAIAASLAASATAQETPENDEKDEIISLLWGRKLKALI